MIVKTSWNILKSVIINNRCNYEFVRHPIIQKEYQEHIKTINKNYNNIGEYIKFNYLKNNKHALLINNFPYYIDDDINHYVFWSIYNNDINNLQNTISKYKQVLWYENYENKKSVLDLWHVQVFILKH